MLARLYLHGIENNEDARTIMRTKLNLKVACDMVVNAWQKVKPDMIQKCFDKAGFTCNADRVPEDSDDSNEDMQPERNVWESIQQALGVNISFEDYATADDEIETTEHLTDKDIVDLVQGNNVEDPSADSQEDPDDEVDPAPEHTVTTSSQFLDITSQLRAYLQRNKLDCKSIDQLEKTVLDSKIVRSTRQQSILNFIEH